MSKEVNANEIREAVRERYAGAAKAVQGEKQGGCCSSPSVSQSALYELSQVESVPEKAMLASLGCGNPTLLAELKEGETVLDLGSGGGIDVLLSAKRVGPAGKAYGLDMTDEMLELARANAREAKVANVEFLKGEIEAIPLPDASVDVIISNCVINLSADKDAVLGEAYRVLKPGGRFAVSDIVVQGGPLPKSVQKMVALWAGCIAGALTEEEYRSKLSAAGFVDVDLEALKSYGVEDVPDELCSCVPPDLVLPSETKIVSAFVRAVKAGGTNEPRQGRKTLPIGTAGPSRVTVRASSCCGDTVKSYFKQVAPRWDEMRKGYFTEEVREAVIARAGLTPSSVVADVGTGTGFMLAGLAPLVARAHGFDNSPEMLEVAHRNLGGAANVELAISEGNSLPLPSGALDAAFANMYLHHASDPAAAVAEMARVLKSGGRLVITDLDRHEHGWLMVEMTDLWPGFERGQVEEWLKSAGLTDVRVESTGTNCCGTSCSGTGANISIFVASGTKV